jgi:hypothetical protein
VSDHRFVGFIPFISQADFVQVFDNQKSSIGSATIDSLISLIGQLSTKQARTVYPTEVKRSAAPPQDGNLVEDKTSHGVAG